MDFPYQKEYSKLFGEILRPLIEFDIKTNIGWISVMGYLDSGADITLIEEVPYLLGRKDIFDKFRIIFEEYNKRIILEKV